MRNFVFFHIPRTGGSSIWHSLAHLAASRGLAVCDIYHECRQRGCTLAGAKDVVREARLALGDAPCLFHHHTAEAAMLVFDRRESLLATVLRDPVDRMVSEVVHHSHFVRTHADRKFVEYHALHWGRPFFDACSQPGIDIRELLDIAVDQKYFRMYYSMFFGSFFDMASLSPELPARIRQVFSVIGHFDHLETSYTDIAILFGLGAATMDRTINTGNERPVLSDSERRRYTEALHVDYELFDQITGAKAAA